jgi:hypothetical protein
VADNRVPGANAGAFGTAGFRAEAWYAP